MTATTDDAKLRDLVFQALDNARENGYAESLLAQSDDDVALDLIDYDASIFEDVTRHSEEPAVMDIVPHVAEWWKINTQ